MAGNRQLKRIAAQQHNKRYEAKKHEDQAEALFGYLYRLGRKRGDRRSRGPTYALMLAAAMASSEGST